MLLLPFCHGNDTLRCIGKNFLIGFEIFGSRQWTTISGARLQRIHGSHQNLPLCRFNAFKHFIHISGKFLMKWFFTGLFFISGRFYIFRHTYKTL